MKKYILLLLATASLYGQTYQNPTYGKLKLKNNQTSTTAEKVNVQETDGTINTISKSDLVNVVDVNDVHSLPLVGEVGKIYVVKNLNKIYRWNGTFYQELAGSDLNYQSIIDALTFTPENVANKATTLTASSTLYPNNNAVIAGLETKENVSNKVTSIGSSANDTNYPSELAVKTYADNLVVGMLNDRGTWDASVNAFPTTGGSGVGGAIRKGDMWYVSVAGTLGTKSVNVGDSFRALVNAPAQVAANWSILEANIGYVPANDSNVVHLTGAETIAGVKSFASLIKQGAGTFTFTVDGGHGSGPRLGLSSTPSGSYDFFEIGAFNSQNNFASKGRNFAILSTIGGVEDSRLKLIANTGNVIIQNGGTFTDDLTNRLQVTGTISSGTTALGNTPPTANNQLTRKDYVDTGLNSKEPSFTKNTAFNKNFGTTAGTVAEGNDSRINNGQTAFGWGNHASAGYALTTGSNINQASFRTALGLGSNAYTSTAYLPLSGGDVSGLLKVIWGGRQLVLTGSDQGAVDLYKTGTLGHRLFSDGNSFGIYDLAADVERFSISIATGAATFSSTVTASPATASNHVVVKSQLDAVKPYKVYTALLSQAGTSAPVATVLENTLGGTVVWSRINTGKYLGTLTGAFTGDKTISFFQTGSSSAGSTYTYDSYKDSNNSVRLYALSNGSYLDQIIAGQIEIRVYN